MVGQHNGRRPDHCERQAGKARSKGDGRDPVRVVGMAHFYLMRFEKDFSQLGKKINMKSIKTIPEIFFHEIHPEALIPFKNGVETKWCPFPMCGCFSTSQRGTEREMKRSRRIVRNRAPPRSRNGIGPHSR